MRTAYLAAVEAPRVVAVAAVLVAQAAAVEPVVL